MKESSIMERIARAINPIAWMAEEQLSQREETLRAAARVMAEIERMIQEETSNQDLK